MLQKSAPVKKMVTVGILAVVLTAGILAQRQAVPVSSRAAALNRAAPGRTIFFLPEVLQKADWNLMCRVNRLPVEPAAYVLGWTTYMGTKLYLFLLIAALMLVWDSGHFARRFSLVFLSLVSLEGVVALLKHLLARPRPFIQAAQGAGGCDLQVFFTPPDSFSMPSGHSAAAFAAAALICGIYGNRYAALYIFAAIIAMSRIFVGVHFPSDILAGMLLGLAWAWISIRAGRQFFQDGPPRTVFREPGR